MSFSCLVQILRFIDHKTWLDFKLIDRGDNLTFDKIQRINVTHETTMPVEFCSVTFLNKQINNPLTEMKEKSFVLKNFAGIDLTLKE